MTQHGIELYLIVLHCVLWYCIGIAWYCIGIAWYCMVLQDIALYCTVSFCIVPLLASARGLYLARHLSTLVYKIHHTFPLVLEKVSLTLSSGNFQFSITSGALASSHQRELQVTLTFEQHSQVVKNSGPLLRSW